MSKENYFLIAVSTKENLDLCMKYSMAGFTNSINGIWAFIEMEKGDYVSFLYGAKVYNLYRIKEKIALKNAYANSQPWKPIKFRSGRIYYFPFRLTLEIVRNFQESMVKPEFAYVAENLLLRGGYRKTHFQADQTTLQSVSQMGETPCPNIDTENTKFNNTEIFTPIFTWDKNKEKIPEIFYFREIILQSIIKKWLSDDAKLQEFFKKLNLNFEAKDFEVLSEKALSSGFVDIFIKHRTPIGISKEIVIEVKLNKPNRKDVEQIKHYKQELANECIASILIAKNFYKSILKKCKDDDIKCFSYNFRDIENSRSYNMDEILSNFYLEEMSIEEKQET